MIFFSYLWVVWVNLYSVSHEFIYTHTEAIIFLVCGEGASFQYYLLIRPLSSSLNRKTENIHFSTW